MWPPPTVYPRRLSALRLARSRTTPRPSAGERPLAAGVPASSCSSASAAAGARARRWSCSSACVCCRRWLRVARNSGSLLYQVETVCRATSSSTATAVRFRPATSSSMAVSWGSLKGGRSSGSAHVPSRHRELPRFLSLQAAKVGSSSRPNCIAASPMRAARASGRQPRGYPGPMDWHQPDREPRAPVQGAT